MKYSGVIRIDHARGIFRLFWIPEGMSPEEGAYVRYPSSELLRIIALESVRNKTVVVAEDLGTIGKNVRTTLKRFRMLSYRLFYFERDYPEPSFLAPDRYPRLALCAVSTHDLPTISGYWAGRDLEIKKKLGQYPDEKVFMQRLEERMRDKSLIISALKSRELFSGVSHAEEGDGPHINQEIILAVYRYLALTPCLLLLVSLDDILGVLDQQNMPGTVGSYPNWRTKTPISLEEIAADRGIAELLRAIAKTL
jgi:4-alpha-glucanotransferase